MLKLTENAIERLQTIAKDHNRKYCRLAVKGGGCAGFEYEWTTTDNEERGDVLLKDILVVNRDYELFLLGTTLDYVKGAFKSEFTITNPNAKSSCVVVSPLPFKFFAFLFRYTDNLRSLIVSKYLYG